MERPFQLTTPLTPRGDQPKAIQALRKQLRQANSRCTLLGVTGSGKTFTLAKVIQELQVPTLVLAPNKTLAGQLYQEFLELFPHNAVEYFVSYYDYYQPEAYLPASDTYIEKDARINEQIDRLRNAATASLLARKDVIVVASVSCIYGLGDPETYAELALELRRGMKISRQNLLRGLVRTQHSRSENEFSPGSFRVRGTAVEIWPIHERDRVWRLEFDRDEVEELLVLDPLTGEILQHPQHLRLYPVGHYVQPENKMAQAIGAIQAELKAQSSFLIRNGKDMEAERLERRVLSDIEDLNELGFCLGLENYSRHFEGREPGQPPFTLMHYFGNDFLCILDESHVSLSQVYGMVKGDAARKKTLINHGFRLPSAADNRPLSGPEFENLLNRVLYVSATPAARELALTNQTVVEQIVRPTNLLDPKIEVEPAKGQVEKSLLLANQEISEGGRVLVTTLTKRSAEDLTEYFQNQSLKARYLHADIDTLERSELLRDLRLGVFDVLIGINLLREGLDLPEVSLVLILDADQQGFLRSATSLIQTCGRAARNERGRVIFFGDEITKAMAQTIHECDRRREIQEKFNRKHNLVPRTIQKKVAPSLASLLNQKENPIGEGPAIPSVDDKEGWVIEKKRAMVKAASDLNFEEAIRLRDEIRRVELLSLDVSG